MANRNKISLPWYVILTIFFLCAGCYGSKQIVVDESLGKDSEKWEARVKGGVMTMAKTSFGPYKTVGYAKVDTPAIRTRSHPSLSFHLFRRTEYFTHRKAYTLRVAEGMDTANILFSILFQEARSDPGLFSKKDAETVNDKKNAQGAIRIIGDTINWSFAVNSFGIDPLIGSNPREETSGYLLNHVDTFMITHLDRFTDGKPGFAHMATKGINLENSNSSVAALQLVGKNFVWIRNDLPRQKKLVIAALFCVMLCSKDL
jgi:hypothetical protein